MHLLSSSSLQNTPVVNRAGENLGVIKDLMIDIEMGRIAYAVLDFGAIFGDGNKLFALPWRGFAVNTVREEIVLDVPRELLEDAEGFDQDDWPDMSDPAFRDRIYNYYRTEPYWKPTV